MRDAKEHGRRRRVISQCLSETNVRAFEPTISSQIDNFIKCLAPSAGMEWSAVMNMSKWCDHHLFDLMTKIIFSASYNALQEDEYKEIMECLAESNVRMSALWNAPVLKSFRLDKYLFPKAIIARNVFIRFVGQMVNERSKKADCHDVFSRLWAHANLATEEALSPSQIVAESTTLIVAGSDTTSTALAATLFYLSTNSKAYQQVINEVRSTFGLKEEIKAGPKLSSCLYLRASIHEAMRLSPSAGGPLWREVKKDGIVIDGIFVPEGCDVGMGIYSIQHQASHFPDPFSYKPERWLKDISKSDIFNSAYMAFSTGPRGCVGKSLALLELSLTMANILWALDFESDFADISGGGFGCHPSEFFMRDHITAVHNGPFLKFRERQY
ncbi:benzoate 4-monooxygenase cytochrome p450 [Phlyctema vagabunda]|uniref:Benzoate 4-monooxygenase cytochrome p450 n=1 Tax=Phlyctema vagabunda TaxID=108571 RepID=A0ABR4P708_9HELO